ncbi:AAA family ATPase [Myxococcota bacterium]|nr:AAA family ATPase [Myxococcota bacterium]
MRILNVRFANLNSLAGSWEIDFTEPAYGNEGIFVITGPTGAGKSTILDAICLALYGRTPRLKKVTQSENDLMSRRTGECFAEVTFQTAAGTWRTCFRQTRAHKKPDGNLQVPRHEISDAVSGEILDASLRGVADRVVALTGMDYDRFTRSMLLAQGGFAAFLQARSEERASSLEQITGTGVYAEISMQVHARTGLERQRMQTLRAELAGREPLPPDAEAELAEELARKNEEEQAVTGQMARLQKSLTWVRELARLESELGEAHRRVEALELEEKAFEPARVGLARAKRALELDAGHERIVLLQQAQETDRQALAQDLERLPMVEDGASRSRAAGQEARGRHEAAVAMLEEMTPAFRKARELDLRITALSLSVGNAGTVAIEAEANLNRLRERMEREMGTAHEQQQELAQVLARIEAHAVDASLPDQMARWTTRLDHLREQDLARQAALRELEDGKTRLSEARKQEKLARDQLEKRLKKAAAAQETLMRTEARLGSILLGRTLSGWAREQAELSGKSLELKQSLQRISHLDQHREHLHEGEPCPLCGSTDHPYAHSRPTGIVEGEVPENTPRIDDARRRLQEEISQVDLTLAELVLRLQEANRIEHELETNRTTERKCREELASEREAAQELVHRAELIARELEARERDHGRHQERLAQDWAVLCADLADLGIAEPELGRLDPLLEDLGNRRDRWGALMRDKARLEAEITNRQVSLRHLGEQVQAAVEALDACRTGLEGLRREHAQLIGERDSLLPDPDVDGAERRLREAIATTHMTLESVRAEGEAAALAVAGSRARIEAVQVRIAHREIEVATAREAFHHVLAAAGFVDPADYLAARMSDVGRRELERLESEFVQRRTTLLEARAGLDARLAVQRALEVNDRSSEALEQEISEQVAVQKECFEALGRLRQRIGENDQLKLRHARKLEEFEHQRLELERWDQLHDLIGAADGKKYRVFAQGLTLDVVIGHANRQLRELSDRYLLVREKDTLELCVVDDYQAGEIRSTRNLSGGETFLVSLALALGLARMSSRNVRVDSLFLDEGFGTLDDETLENALGILAGLRQDGKLIGVISHVAALKERIGVQIRVTPVRGGRSELSGPGCRSVKAKG